MTRAVAVSARVALGLVGLAVVVAAGCAKKPTPGGVRLEQISEAFSAAGLHVAGFVPTDPTPFSATRCVDGRVDDVDTVVCEYGSSDALALGKRAGEQWAGNATTASVLGNGRTLLAVADRARTDPNGKTIHRITQAFLKTR